MKLKRIISFVLSVSMALSWATYVDAENNAEVIVSANADQTEVTVTCDFGDTQGLLTAIAFTTNGNVADSKLFFTTFTEEAGAISATASIPDGFDSGIYRVIVSNTDGKGTGEFVFSKTSDIIEVMGYMNAELPENYGSESDYITAVTNIITNNPGKLGLDEINQASLFAELGQVFAKHKGAKVYTDSAVFISEFNQCLAAVILNNNGDVQSTITKYSQYIGSEVAALDTYPSAVKSLVIDDLKTIDYSKGLLSKQLPEMRVVAFFKTSETWGAAKLNILGQNELGTTYIDNFSILNPALSNYNRLTSVNDVYKKLFDSRGSINTIDELRSEFEKYSLQVYNSESKDGDTLGGENSGSKDVISNYNGGGSGNSDEEKEPIVEKEVFNDISNHWAKTYIQNLYMKNVISGYPDGSFKPQNPVSRAEYVKMLVSIGFDKYVNFENKFTDVREKDWHYNYIMTALANGIVSGISETEFSPNSQITRQDACLMVYNYLKPQVKFDIDEYPDDAKIDNYARNAVYALSALGVVSGCDNGKFEPKNPITRAESAVVLSKMMKLSAGELGGYVSPEEKRKADAKAAELDFKYGVLTAANNEFSMDMRQQTVSRGEFLHALVQMMGEIPDGGEISFSDVSADSKYYNSVAYALNMGWIEDGDKFSPDSAATIEFAVKLGVHAIGAKRYAELSGSGMAGYEKVAQSNDFYADMDAEEKAMFSPEAACVLLYNIITSPTCIIDYSVKESFRTDGKPILETIHNMYTYEGVFYANRRTDIQNEAAVRYDTLRVGNHEFVCDDNYDKYLGQNVMILYETEDDEHYLRFMSPYRNTIAEFNNNTFQNVNGMKVDYEEHGEKKSFTLNSDYIYVENGKSKLITSSNLNTLLSKNTTNYKVIDNNRDNRYDVIIAESFAYTYVDKHDLYNGYIYDRFSKDGFIDLSTQDCEYEIFILENGIMVEGTLQDVKENVIIAHYSSDDNKYHKLIICRDTVEGKIGAISTEGNSSIVKINDVDYYRSQYYITNYVTNLGAENIYYLGINNEIVVDELLDSSEKYAWFINVYPNQPALVDASEDVIIKLFTQDGDVVRLPIAEKIKYDGISKDLHETVTSLSGLKNGDDKHRIIKFRLDSDDKVAMIDTATERINDITSFGGSYPSDNALSLHFSGNFQPRPKSIMFDQTSGRAVFNYSNTECIFVIPEVADRDDDRKYKLIGASEIDYHANNSFPFSAYDVTASGSAKVLLRILSDGGSGTVTDWENLKYAVVGKVADVLNSDNELVTQVSIHNGRAFTTVYMDDYTIGEFGRPNPGDIIGYTVDSSDNIKTLVTAFNFLRYQPHTDVANDNERISFTQGFVYSYGDGYMYYFAPQMLSAYKPSCAGTIDTSTLRNLNIAENNMIFVDVIRSADGSQIKSVDIKAESLANIKEYKNSNPEDVTYVVNLTEYVGGNTTFAYQISYE